MNRNRRRSGCLGSFLLATIALTFLTFSCDRQPAGISVEGAWSMPVRVDASAGSSNGVVYLTIKNGSRQEDRLTGVETPVCGSVRIHRTTMERDRMMMQPVNEPIEIAAGGSVRFQPRGLHIMLIGLKRSLVAGETFRLVLRFEKGGRVGAVSKVRTP